MELRWHHISVRQAEAWPSGGRLLSLARCAGEDDQVSVAKLECQDEPDVSVGEGFVAEVKIAP